MGGWSLHDHREGCQEALERWQQGWGVVTCEDRSKGRDWMLNPSSGKTSGSTWWESHRQRSPTGLAQGPPHYWGQEEARKVREPDRERKASREG